MQPTRAMQAGGRLGPLKPSLQGSRGQVKPYEHSTCAKARWRISIHKDKTLALFPILGFRSYLSYMDDPACHRYDNSRYYHHHHQCRQCKKSSYEVS